jgi:hypothetical protein
MSETPIKFRLNIQSYPSGSRPSKLEATTSIKFYLRKNKMSETKSQALIFILLPSTRT